MYISDLITALKDMQKDIERISGLEVTWKDADPTVWPQLPLALAQHQHALCTAAKANPQGFATCSQHCNHARGKFDSPHLVNCPFGARELRIPLFIGERYLGTLSIGPWQGNGKRLHTQLKKIHSCLRGKDDAYAKALARCIQPRLQLASLQSTNQQTHDGDQERREQVRVYIDQHVHLQLRAASVARICSLSTSRFLHWFTAAMGTNYRVYIQQEVLKKSAQQLLASKERIIDIAFDCGYHSASAYAAAFKKQFGQQPSQFRRSHKQRI